MLIQQVNRNAPKVEIQYIRAVRMNGNSIAKKHLSEVFEPCDAIWRGFGLIPSSGLILRKNYDRFNVEKSIPVKIQIREDNKLCICGKILRGLKTPAECPLFDDICFPENPLGACMVSNEGACNAWYKYKLINE